ncbi:pre-mRNA processing factor 3-domain-containing protein [Choanephora cucurbitarum]|nr:pre-mRNA processing factor 3-domain-containing protein [Choanephora cucurbitarum]
MAKLAKFKPPPPNETPPQKPPISSRSSLVQKNRISSKKVTPIPAPPSAGTGGSLNLVELQRHIAEAKTRLAHAPPGTHVRPARPSDTKPPPLDDAGQFDLKAMMDKIPRRETANTKALARAKQHKSIPAAAEKKPLKLYDEVPADYTDPQKNPYFDPNMDVKIAPKSRRSRQLKFVQPGKYVDIANQERAKAQLEKMKQAIAESVKKAGMQTELDVSDKVIKREPPPPVEWWDAPFLANKSYEDVDQVNVDQLDTLVTMYVHHPVPIQPPGEGNTAIVRSLMLTKKERKKMRRQRRAEALKDKRDKIRLGLIEPDAPKVKISNLMKVLGEEQIQDPTKVEARVRKEMELRQKMHEKANEQRKLSPEERRAKIMAKMKEDQKSANEVAVFK